MVQSCVLKLFIKKEYGHGCVNRAWGLPAKAAGRAANAFVLLRTRQALPFGPDSQARTSYDAASYPPIVCTLRLPCPQAQKHPLLRASSLAPGKPSAALPRKPLLHLPQVTAPSKHPLCTSSQLLPCPNIPPPYLQDPSLAAGPFLPSPPKLPPLQRIPSAPPPSCCLVASLPLSPLPSSKAPSCPSLPAVAPSLEGGEP